MTPDQTLITIRERRQLDLFDLALVVARRRPGPLAWAALAGIAPFLALNAWLMGRAGPGGPMLGLVLWWFEAPLATAPLTVVLGGMMFGRVPSAGGAARQLGRAAGTLAVTHGVLRFLPPYWLPPRLLFANEVVLLEHAGWDRHWRRGADLGGGRDDLILLGPLQGLAVLAFAAVIYLGAGRAIEGVLAEPLTWDWPVARVYATWYFQVPIWVAVAFLAVVRFLTYIDQRIRLEGWEIKLRLHAAGAALAEDRRW